MWQHEPEFVLQMNYCERTVSMGFSTGELASAWPPLLGDGVGGYMAVGERWMVLNGETLLYGFVSAVQLISARVFPPIFEE